MFLLLIAVVVSDAQNGAGVERPRVGVVLSGGGARGATHIGVLKYIEELGIPIDYVVGTSMGSIIGGLYSMGYSPDEMESLIKKIDWSVYMSNTVERSNLSTDGKHLKSTYLMTIPFNTRTFNRTFRNNGDKNLKDNIIASLPSSFIGGASLTNLFNNLSVGYQDSIDFNDLPTPFACIATNFVTGEEEVLNSGKVPTAIRASMAIPGVFSPVVVDNKILVDGGLVNNFPTDICKAMGADLIIGVEVAPGLIEDMDDLQSLPRIVTQLKNIAVKGHNEDNRKLCTVYLHPDMTGFNMLSFNNAAIDTLVNRGYKYAKLYETDFIKIKNIIDSYGPLEEKPYVLKAKVIEDDTITLSSINFSGVSERDTRWLMRKSGLSLDKPMKGNEIERAVNIYKGTGAFSEILYTTKETTDTAANSRYSSYLLNIDLKPSEPHSFSLGFKYDSEESAAILLRLGINAQRLKGWRLILSGKLCFDPQINAKVSWAGMSIATFNLEYGYRQTNTRIFDTSDSHIQFSSDCHTVKFYISEFHLRRFSAAVGIENNTFIFDKIISNEETMMGRGNDSLTNNSFGPFVKMEFDNMDDAYFATKGMKSVIQSHWRFDLTNGKSDEDKFTETGFLEISLSLKTHYTPVKRLTLIPQFYGRVLIADKYHYSYMNVAGGEMEGRFLEQQLPFIGTNYMIGAEKSVAIGRIDLRYNIFGKHYITAMVNYLHTADAIDKFFSDDESDAGYWGSALKYSVNSVFGPISLDVHLSDFKSGVGFFFNFGYVF